MLRFAMVLFLAPLVPGADIIIRLFADATNPTLVNVEPWRTYRLESDDGGCTGWLWLYGTPNQAHAVRHVLRVLPHWERRP